MFETICETKTCHYAPVVQGVAKQTNANSALKLKPFKKNYACTVVGLCIDLHFSVEVHLDDTKQCRTLLRLVNLILEYQTFPTGVALLLT